MAFANGFDPNKSLQGTWERFGNGRTLVGVNESDDSFNTVQKTGGHKDLQNHTHSVNQLSINGGEHSHTIGAWMAKRGSGNTDTRVPDGNEYTYGTYYGGGHTHVIPAHTSNASGSGNAGNLQPFITVYYWVRTA